MKYLVRVFRHAIALDQFCEVRIRTLSLLRRGPLGKDTLPLVVHPPTSLDRTMQEKEGGARSQKIRKGP